MFEGECATEDAGTHHDRNEAGTLLVGPDRDFDRRLGLDVSIIERPDDLERGEHTVVAVEPTAGRLGINVASGDHRWQASIASGAAHEDVADLVDRDAQSRSAAPADDEISA